MFFLQDIEKSSKLLTNWYKNHKIFYKGKMVEAHKFLGWFQNVYKIDYSGELLYNILMEKYDKMIVNNLICETLDTKNFIAKIYNFLPKLNPEQQEEFIRVRNQNVIKNDIYGTSKNQMKR